MGVISKEDALAKSKDKLTKYISGVDGEEQLEVIEGVRDFLTEWKAGLNKQGIKKQKKEESSGDGAEAGSGEE